MIVFLAGIVHALCLSEGYFNFVADRLVADNAGGFLLCLEIHPEFTSRFGGKFAVVVNAAIVLLKYDGIGPGRTLRVKLNVRTVTQIVSLLL